MSSVLFTGGCRSGKSSLAKKWAEEKAPVRAYVATARGSLFAGDGDDAEMAARIARHQQERGPGWLVVEPDAISLHVPLNAVAALDAATKLAGVAVFDCVTLWLSEWLCAGASDEAIFKHVDALAAWVRKASLPVALVTNETGWGVVPESPLGRRFRDVSGFANQRLAAACEHVILAVCGMPVIVK